MMWARTSDRFFTRDDVVENANAFPLARVRKSVASRRNASAVGRFRTDVLYPEQLKNRLRLEIA